MVEISDLTPIAPADITDDDLVVIVDQGAPSAKTKSATAGQLLSSTVRTTGTNTTGTLNAAQLNAPIGVIDTTAIATSLTVGAGAALTKLLRASASVTIPIAAAGVEVSATIAIAGAAIGDAVTVHAPIGWPSGLILRAAISGAGVATIYAFNATALSIASASYTIQAVAMRFA